MNVNLRDNSLFKSEGKGGWGGGENVIDVKNFQIST